MNVDGFIRFAVEHDVRASGVSEIPVANNANPPRFFAARQRFHSANQIAVIVLCLLRRPTLGGIAPHVFKIDSANGVSRSCLPLTAMRCPHAGQEGLAVEGPGRPGRLTSLQCFLQRTHLRFV